MHVCGRVYQTRERRAKLASFDEQLAFYYASQVLTASGSDKELYGREDRAEN